MKKVFLSIEKNRGYGRGLISGIIQYARLYGPWNFYAGTPFYYRSTHSELSSIDIIRKWKPDGIIMREDDNLDEIVAMGIPSVIVNYRSAHIPGVVCVCGALESAGVCAAEHFLARGFKNFAYCGIPDKFFSESRGNGFAERLRQEGFEVDMFHNPDRLTRFTWLRDQERLQKWVRELKKPVAIFTCTDDRAQNVADACKVCSSISVPEDVAILGVDNDELLCEMLNPALSSVSIDSYGAGFEAAEILRKLMDGEQVDSGKIIIAEATHVAARQSTDVFAVEDVDVRGALKFITAHPGVSIQVADVAEACGMTTRTLQKKFKYYLGRTVSAEIDRVRLEYICKLLIESSKTISQISDEIDFISENHFSRYFRRLMKMSPTTYRRHHSTLKNIGIM
jgi:LacI family transcriptional regulator